MDHPHRFLFYILICSSGLALCLTSIESVSSVRPSTIRTYHIPIFTYQASQLSHICGWNSFVLNYFQIWLEWLLEETRSNNTNIPQCSPAEQACALQFCYVFTFKKCSRGLSCHQQALFNNNIENTFKEETNQTTCLEAIFFCLCLQMQQNHSLPCHLVSPIIRRKNHLVSPIIRREKITLFHQ